MNDEGKKYCGAEPQLSANATGLQPERQEAGGWYHYVV
jgi:hypothetical protein